MAIEYDIDIRMPHSNCDTNEQNLAAIAERVEVLADAVNKLSQESGACDPFKTMGPDCLPSPERRGEQPQPDSELVGLLNDISKVLARHRGEFKLELCITDAVLARCHDALIQLQRERDDLVKFKDEAQYIDRDDVADLLEEVAQLRETVAEYEKGDGVWVTKEDLGLAIEAGGWRGRFGSESTVDALFDDLKRRAEGGE